MEKPPEDVYKRQGIALKIKSGEREAAEMIRHILFWKYTDAVKAQHQEAEDVYKRQRLCWAPT